MNEDRGINPSLLLEQAKTGDESAIEELLALHDAGLRASVEINSKWRSVIEVDDIVQVTYFEAVLDLSRFNGNMAGFGSWLRTIAKNNLRDVIKGLEREKRPHPDLRIGALPEQDSVLWLWNFLTGGSASPSGTTARDEIRDALEARIVELPAAYADVVGLVHFQEQSIEEAASVMGRTYGAVYLIHQRALDRLRRLLGSESQFFNN